MGISSVQEAPKSGGEQLSKFITGSKCTYLKVCVAKCHKV